VVTIPDFLNLDFLTPEVLRPEIQAFASGFPVTLLHAGVTLLMLVIGAFIYSILTPYKEIDQIREGNSAAAVAFGGVVIGLAIPLAASMSASTSLNEIIIWGGSTVFLQLLVFKLVDFILTGLPDRINEGEVSAAVLLVSAKLAAALILAAAVAG
jgi:putative membrane protein